jgi:hypothetical protein
MAGRRQLEFLLLRYVPDAVKGEFVNFGVLALENGPQGAELIDVRFTRDWGRVLCLDPQADVEVLTALQREIQQEIGQTKDRADLLRRMEESFSNVVQMSQAVPVLAEVPAVEIETVARTYLETPKLRRTREPAGRRKILETMRDAFEEAGVFALLTAVPVEPYTRPGDPFEFDFGYRVGNEIKLFHAVSLKASIDAAVMLAARYPKIAAAMAQTAGAPAMLTAVVEAELDRSRSEVGFALEMMEEGKIRVATTTEMPAIAEEVRVELRA